MKTALYRRVSTPHQEEGESLTAQLNSLEAYAAQRDWQIVRRYEESASTWNGTRDQYEQMMDDARAGQFDAILVWKLDRFGRRSGQIHSAIEELKRLGIALVLVAENVTLTDDGIVGKVLTSALALTADLENEMRAARTRAACQRRKELGLFNLGQLPSGYRSVGPFRPAVIDEDVAFGIQRAFELYATGRYSILELAHLLNDAGYHLKHDTSYTFRNLRGILNNRNYTGHIRVDGEWLPSREPIIVEPVLFERVQCVMAGHAGAPRSVARHFRAYLLKGILFCSHCQSKMYSQTTGTEPYRYAYYKCGSEQIRSRPCPADAPTLVREDVLALQVDVLVEGISLPDDWQAGVLAALESDEVEEIKRRRQAMAEKMTRVKELYIEGYIGKAEYMLRYSAHQQELYELVVPDYTEVIDAGKYLDNVKLLWDRSSVRRRNEFLRLVFRRLWLDREEQRIVSVEIQPEFTILFRQMVLPLPVWDLTRTTNGSTQMP